MIPLLNFSRSFSNLRVDLEKSENKSATSQMKENLQQGRSHR